MASRDDNKRPIIVRRRKVVAAGHHGGAWKVAYADFVTAMMAFFMLMWLLNATTDKQRKGLADYFSPSVALSKVSGGGDGALGGRSMSADSSRVQLGRGGIVASQKNGTTEDDAALAELEEAIVGKGGESLLDEELLRHVAVRLTDEGLVLEFFALPGSPLFDGSVPLPLMDRLLASVAGDLRGVPNVLAVEAFVAAEPVVTLRPRAWDVSAARADAVRRSLPDVGVGDARVVRVTGHADRHPVARDPLSPRNDRIEIVVLRDRVARRR